MVEKKFRLEYNLQFFAQEGPGGEKTEEATSKKLKDARDEGKVAKSQELSSAFVLIGLFLALKIFVGFVGNRFLSVFNYAYRAIPDVDRMSRNGMTIATARTLFMDVIIQFLIATAPFLVVGFAIALLGNIVQVGWQIATKALQPKLDKFNPVNGFKRIFSKDSIFNLLKSFIKIGLIFYVAYSCLKDQANNLFFLYDMSLNQAIAFVGQVIIDTGLRISLVYLVVGIADYIYMKHKFKEDMKMTKQEVKDEYKSTEGDPQIKGQQRQRMREASQRRMMASVPQADVVITNPTHLSIALKYDFDNPDVSAPVCVAKGEDFVALRIREVARENGVEIVENKPLARALYPVVEVGDAIPPEMYEVVAEILAEVYRKQGRIG